MLGNLPSHPLKTPFRTVSEVEFCEVRCSKLPRPGLRTAGRCYPCGVSETKSFIVVLAVVVLIIWVASVLMQPPLSAGDRHLSAGCVVRTRASASATHRSQLATYAEGNSRARSGPWTRQGVSCAWVLTLLLPSAFLMNCPGPIHRTT